MLETAALVVKGTGRQRRSLLPLGITGINFGGFRLFFSTKRAAPSKGFVSCLRLSRCPSPDTQELVDVVDCWRDGIGFWLRKCWRLLLDFVAGPGSLFPGLGSWGF